LYEFFTPLNTHIHLNIFYYYFIKFNNKYMTLCAKFLCLSFAERHDGKPIDSEAFEGMTHF